MRSELNYPGAIGWISLVSSNLEKFIGQIRKYTNKCVSQMSSPLLDVKYTFNVTNL